MTTDYREFKEIVWEFYHQHGRDFPWREPIGVYEVWVSEVMLQQTQADRVVPKYEAFMRRFPDVQSLAAASTADVLKLWQGLGYNRRALQLKQAAELVVQEYAGEMPTEEAALLKLPGIGPYTAAAIAAFAGNRPTIVVETNIRTVYIHHFFRDAENIDDKELIPLIAATVDQENPRQWYGALMDYGAHLKKVLPNPSRRSKHYVRQSAFEGSPRQARGAVLRELAAGPADSVGELEHRTGITDGRIPPAVEALLEEGFIVATPRLSLVA